MNSIAPPSAVALVGSPFDHNHADPWAKTFIDLPELNAPVTDAIANAITHVRTTARQTETELLTSSLLVLGPAGAGKTHLFARLRRKLGPKAIFVHLRPLVGTEMTPRYVLGQIVHQLGYETMRSGTKQLGTLVGSALAHLNNESPDMPRVFLDEIEGLDEKARAEKLEWALEQLLERHPQADDTYLARLLEAPFLKTMHQRAALAWLGGQELEEAQLKRLGVQGGLAEERVMKALATLGLFAAPGAPIVLVFDQLENLMDAEATGTRVRAYANLVAELFDATRGFVLVQMALDSEWQHAILPQLSTAQTTRLAGHTRIISLPTPDQSRALVAQWVAALPVQEQPFPWPFGEPRVKHWSETPGMTPRMLMIACRQALALGPDAPFEPPQTDSPSSRAVGATDVADDDASLAGAWGKHLEGARKALDEAGAERRSADPARLVGGVAGALRILEGVKASRVDARQYLQLVAKAGDRSVSLAFLHQNHPKSVATALDRAAEGLAKSHVILARERGLEFAPTWKKVRQGLEVLVEKGAQWLVLEREDAARLLALESFLAAAKSRDLEDATGRVFDEKEVEQWVSAGLQVTEWPLVQALLGKTMRDEQSDLPVAAPSSPTLGAGPEASAIALTIRACLTRLRVASLERLIREVARVTPQSTRNDVIQALDGMPGAVRWFGRSIVAFVDEVKS